MFIKDVAGVIHGPFNLSKDPRGVAMDAAPPGLRRRAARDQMELPDQIDGDFAVVLIMEVLARAK